MFKKISIILSITFTFLILIEFFSWISFNLISNQKLIFYIRKKTTHDEQCANFIFDLHLGHIHNENIECKIDKKIERGFVYYNHEGSKISKN